MITNEAPVTPGVPGSFLKDAEGKFHPIDENGVPTDGYVVPSATPTPTAGRTRVPPTE